MELVPLLLPPGVDLRRALEEAMGGNDADSAFVIEPDRIQRTDSSLEEGSPCRSAR
jgi:hypothetical protein